MRSPEFLELGAQHFEDFGDCREGFPSSGSFLDFWDFDHFGHPAGPSARRGAAYVSGQNFATFAFQKPRLGHMLEQTPLFIFFWLWVRY